MQPNRNDGNILELKGIGHNFGGLTVLRNVTFSVGYERIVGLIGPNGSGKTTLFNAITGFLTPRIGTIVYQGQVLGNSPVRERSRRGMLRTFQTPKVFEHMTVLENVMVGCCKGTHTTILQDLARTTQSRKELRIIRDLSDETLDKFELSALRNTPAGSLTAGQRRILEIARAVVDKPKLLLLDEPSSGLNHEEIENLRRWIIQLRKEGISVLIVSHDMELITIADIVHVLYFGEIIKSGVMDEIKSNPRVREVYLGI
jgi:ABC-type branched-subunit amino acid transport system ATPase component